jgi:twitching motility protein PilU
MDITPFLKLMMEKNGSDLFFSTGAPISMKVEGTTKAVAKGALPPGMVKKMAYSLMNDNQVRDFEANLEMNLAIALQDVGRYRVNIFRQRGEVAMVIRSIKTVVPSIEELGLPVMLRDLVMEKRGLILVVGATGSGKSTSLAAMLNYRNENSSGHILTIEDPIEFVHRHKQSIVNQREVGLDTLDYENALVNAMREAPDVILIGEVRDRETMQHAIAYAGTGHLCLATLHANNANQTLDRIINFFPETAHRQLFMDLSLYLRAVVSQRLVIGVDNKRVPAVEVLLNTAYIAELILKGEVGAIKDAMAESAEDGIKTFDQSLFELYEAGQINAEEALRNADSRNNLGLRIRMSQGDDGESDEFGAMNLDLSGSII